MDRNSVLRWIFIAGLMYLGYHFFLEKKPGDAVAQAIGESYIDAPSFAPDVLDVEPGKPVPPPPPPGESCTIHGNRYVAELSSRGAGLTHFWLTDARYAKSDAGDMSTTPDHERWRNLRTLFRHAGTPLSPDDQLKYDRFEWKLDPSSAAETCRFTYEDEQAKVVKTIAAGERPFELNVETTLTNLADSPKRHVTSIEAFAYRSKSPSPIATRRSRTTTSRRPSSRSTWRRARAARSRPAQCSRSSGSAPIRSPTTTRRATSTTRASSTRRERSRPTSRRRTARSPSSARRSATFWPRRPGAGRSSRTSSTWEPSRSSRRSW